MKIRPYLEAQGHLTDQEIPHILQTPKFHYCVQNSSSPVLYC